jgi:peptide/nickel transport system substrate-binding protein
MRAAALLAMFLLLAACSKAETHAGRIVVLTQREPLSLNAALENGASSTMWGELLFNYLLKWNDKGELVGDIATEVPTRANGGISADGKTIVYHLRSGVRFSDGSPLTARDCVYSIEAILNPRNNVQTRYGYDRIARAQASDARTLVLRLKEPFAPIFTLVLAPQGFPILPAHLLAQYPDFNHLPFNERPVGGGPYVVRDWRHGDRVELDANPYYFRGTPRIAHMTIRFVSDENTAINQLRTGEGDLLFNDSDMGNVNVLATMPNVVTLRTPVNAVGALIFNTQDPATRDPAVRRAFTEAIDVPALVRKTYRGAVDARDAGRGLFEWAYDPRYPLVTPYDPAAAKALLARRHLSLLMLIQANTPGDAILGSAVQQYERAAGVDVTLKQYEITQFVAPASAGGPVYGGKFQIAYYPFVNGDDPDVSDQFFCANIPPHGYNKSRFCNSKLDTLLIAARRTYDPGERKQYYAQIQQLLSELLPIVLLYQRREIDAYNSRLHGVVGSVSSIFWNVGTWYI